MLKRWFRITVCKTTFAKKVFKEVPVVQVSQLSYFQLQSTVHHLCRIWVVGYKGERADLYIKYIWLDFWLSSLPRQIYAVNLQACQVSHTRCQTQSTGSWLTLPFTTQDIPYTLMQLCSTPPFLMGIWLSWQWWSPGLSERTAGTRVYIYQHRASTEAPSW